MTRFRNILVAAGAVFALSAFASAQVQPAKPTAADLKAAAAYSAAKMVVNLNPCACLKEYVDWCKQSPPKKINCLSYNFTVHSNNGLLGYNEGWLYWHPENASFVHATTSGDPYWLNEARDGAGQPFNRPAMQRDVITIHANTCTVTYKIGTNPTLTTPTLQCNNGFYYAFEPARGCLYVLTLKKQSMDIIY